MDNKETYYKLSSVSFEETTTVFIDEDTISKEDFEEGDLFDEYKDQGI